MPAVMELSMRCLTAFLACLLFAALAVAQEEHHHALSEEEVGSVHFSTSCRADPTQSFNRAVALLHSFQYEDARAAFTEIASRDPQCAMAQWGVAMSHYHGLWDNGDTAAGRAAIEKAQQIAASNPKTSAREAACQKSISKTGKIYMRTVKPSSRRWAQCRRLIRTMMRPRSSTR
jgi:hypothetical protein